MDENDWYAQIRLWAENDEKLKRLPFVFMSVLSRYLAQHDKSAQQKMHQTAFGVFLSGVWVGVIFVLSILYQIYGGW